MGQKIKILLKTVLNRDICIFMEQKNRRIQRVKLYSLIYITGDVLKSYFKCLTNNKGEIKLSLLDGLKKLSDKLPKLCEEVEYVGGCIKYDKNFKGQLMVYNDKIELLNSILDKYIINVEDIKSVEFKTYEQISKDVTLTRLLLVGIFAFGLKKKRVDTSNYAVIETEKDKIILKSKNANAIVNSIKRIKR